MSYSPASPVTGGAQTGFTTPTYTLVSDVAPDTNGKQHAVSAVSGAGNTPEIHSVSSPFTATFVRPKVFKTLGKANPVTGVINSVPRNAYKLITRKGVLPLAGQPQTTAMVTTIIEVPAGSDIADAVSLRAMMSLHVGILSEQSAGIGDSTTTGII